MTRELAAMALKRFHFTVAGRSGTDAPSRARSVGSPEFCPRQTPSSLLVFTPPPIALAAKIYDRLEALPLTGLVNFLNTAPVGNPGAACEARVLKIASRLNGLRSMMPDALSLVTSFPFGTNSARNVTRNWEAPSGAPRVFITGLFKSGNVVVPGMFATMTSPEPLLWNDA